MPEIADEYMKQMLATTKSYTAVILKRGAAYKMPDVFPLIWEHARRNFLLREDGVLMIVCPISEDKEMAGVGIFNADAATTKALLEEDPAIKAGVLVYEMYPTRSFPGDSLKS